MKEPEFRKLVRKQLIKLSEGLNKKDVSYQLSIDYSGNTKPKVTTLNNKKITIFYGYKTNPKDVIKSLQKLDPSLKIKHKGWKNNSSGGGVHSFVFESKLDESGILYKAGVKKYGKEGMEKIQSAAGKGEGHEEIGKIKDKFEKGKTNEVEEITEANPFRNTKGLKPLLKFGTIVTTKVGEKALLQFSDAFEDLDNEQADDLASHLNMAIELMQDGSPSEARGWLKKFNKVCKAALKGRAGKSAFENVNEAKEEYKYKKQVAKAFDKINDAMFNFRHAFGVKQLTNDNMKLKKKFEALQANIFALQRELRSDGLSEGKLTELKFVPFSKVIKAEDLLKWLKRAKEGAEYTVAKLNYKKVDGKWRALKEREKYFSGSYTAEELSDEALEKANGDIKWGNGNKVTVSEGKLTEAKIKKGDIIKMDDGEYGVVNKVSGKVAYIKLQSSPGSFHPIEAARITYKGKHKGKDLYNESSVRES